MNLLASEHITPTASPTLRELHERLGFALDDNGTRAALLELETRRRLDERAARAEIDAIATAPVAVCRVCGSNELVRT